MENNETTEANNFNERKTLLKSISTFVIREFKFLIILVISGFILTAVTYNIFHSKMALLCLVLSLLNLPITLFLLPSFIGAICAVRYYKGKSNGKLTASWIWGFIALISNLFVIYVIPRFIDSIAEFPGYVYIIYSIFIFGAICMPNILYLIGCYKESAK